MRRKTSYQKTQEEYERICKKRAMKKEVREQACCCVGMGVSHALH